MSADLEFKAYMRNVQADRIRREREAQEQNKRVMLARFDGYARGKTEAVESLRVSIPQKAVDIAIESCMHKIGADLSKHVTPHVPAGLFSTLARTVMEAVNLYGNVEHTIRSTARALVAPRLGFMDQDDGKAYIVSVHIPSITWNQVVSVPDRELFEDAR